jgi:hypothetical protein
MDNSRTQRRTPFQRGQDSRDEGILTVAVERRGSVVDQCQLAG